jgi:hypothetical protein
MSNKLEFEPGVWEVEAGKTLDADLEEIQAEYVEIHRPKSAQIKCVELWICPHCRQQNFAEITFIEQNDHLLVKDIKSIALTPDYLDQIHYITFWINDWAERFSDQKLFSNLKPQPTDVQRLKETLINYHNALKE